MKKRFLYESKIVSALLCAILIICFYDVIFQGKTFKLTTGNPQALSTGPFGQENNRPEYYPVHSTDVPVFEEPIMQFIRNSLRQGILPLWNPHQACGMPFVGMMHSGIFFPLNYVLYLLPNTISWDILIFLRMFFCGFFTYWLMRTLKFKPIPSFSSATALMISAPMIFIHWNVVNVDILLPLLLLVHEKLIRKPDLQHAAFIAIVIALTCFAGNPEHVFLVNTYGLIFFVFRLITTKQFLLREWLKILSLLVAAYLGGALLSSIVLFPFLFNWFTEFWHAHFKYIGAVPEGINIRLETLINFVMPSFFQKEIVTTGFERSTFWGHIGIIPLGLAFISLFSKQRKGLNWFFAIVAFLIFAKSYIDFPLTNWIGLLPVFRDCRFTHHTQFLFFLSIMMLSGMGIRLIIAKRKAFCAGLIYAVLLIPLITTALFYHRAADHFTLSVQSFIFAITILFVFLLVLFLRQKNVLKPKILSIILPSILILELFLYIPRSGRVNRFDSFPEVPYINFLKNKKFGYPSERARSFGTFWTFYPNTASGYGMDDFGVVDGLLPKRYVGFINHFIIPDYFNKEKTTSAFWVMPITFTSAARPYFDMLNLKYSIAPTFIEQLFPPTQTSDFQQPIYANEVKIYTHELAFPRVFIVHKAIFEPNEELLIEKMKKISKAFNFITLLHADPVLEIQEKLAPIPMQTNSSAKIIRYTPNEVLVETDMVHPGFLIFSDSYHPDWKVFVNGKTGRIFLANMLVRGVFLEKGKHTVSFRFQPFSFYIGGLMSAITLIVLLLIVFFSKKKS